MLVEKLFFIPLAIRKSQLDPQDNQNSGDHNFLRMPLQHLGLERVGVPLMQARQAIVHIWKWAIDSPYAEIESEIEIYYY